MGASWGSLGSLLGPRCLLGCLAGPLLGLHLGSQNGFILKTLLGGLLEASEGRLGGLPGASWEPLGASWWPLRGLLGSLLGPLMASWEPLGASWAPLAILAVFENEFESILGRLGRPRPTQDRSKPPQDRPKIAQDRPKTAQDRSQGHPR